MMKILCIFIIIRMSANAILTTMKGCNPESYMDWNKRGTFDYIILYDWNSSFDHRSIGLSIVYDAVTKVGRKILFHIHHGE